MIEQDRSERDLTAIRLLQYLQRLKMELETTLEKLRSGRIRIERAHVGKGKGPEEVEVGTGGARAQTSPLSLLRDENAERRVVVKHCSGRPGADEGRDLEPVDLENLKIRVFTEVFPEDPHVRAYRAATTLENRFNLLIHVGALEAGVTAADYMDLHGLTTDYLCGKLREAIESKDKQVSARFLGLAFNLKAPRVVTVKKAEQNIFNFGSKSEGVERVEQKIKEIGEGAREAVESMIGEITGAQAQEE